MIKKSLAILAVLAITLPPMAARSTVVSSQSAPGAQTNSRTGTASLAAAAIPIKDMMGVNAVVNNNPSDLAQVTGWVRDYHKWYWYEENKDAYTWSTSWQRLDWFYSTLKAAGVKVMPDVEFAPGWASSNGDVKGIPNPAEHAEYLGELVRHYGSTIAAVENYNEPNQTWQPVRFPAGQFGAMTAQDYSAVKTANPSTTFVLAGMAGTDTTYLDKAAAASGGKFDVVNIHWYATGDTVNGGKNPESGGLMSAIDQAKAWRDAKAPGKPIWISEFGWDTFMQPDGRKSDVYAPEGSAANYLLRTLFLMQGRGVEKGFVFGYRDVSPNSQYLHNRYLSAGLVTDNAETDGRKKPGWYYLATLKSVLGDYSFDRIVSDGPNVYHYEYAVPGTNKRAAVMWAASGERDSGYQVNYKGPAGTLVVPTDGSTTGTVSTTDGNLTLTERPVFVLYTGDVAPASLTTAPNPAPQTNLAAVPATPTPCQPAELEQVDGAQQPATTGVVAGLQLSAKNWTVLSDNITLTAQGVLTNTGATAISGLTVSLRRLSDDRVLASSATLGPLKPKQVVSVSLRGKSLSGTRLAGSCYAVQASIPDGSFNRSGTFCPTTNLNISIVKSLLSFGGTPGTDSVAGSVQVGLKGYPAGDVGVRLEVLDASGAPAGTSTIALPKLTKTSSASFYVKGSFASGYTLRATADPNGLITETDETDNVASMALQTAPVLKTGKWTAGTDRKTLSVQVTISNLISATARLGPVTISLERSDGTKTLKTANIWSLAPGGTSSTTLTGVDQDGLSGRNYVVKLAGKGINAPMYSPAWPSDDSPTIRDLLSTPDPFSPNADGVKDSTVISYVLSKPAIVTIGMYDSSDSLVRVLVASGQRAPGQNAETWDGHNQQDAVAAGGTYTYKIDATDSSGNAASQQAGSVTIDTTSPTISQMESEPDALSPNGDGVQDTTTISFTLSETATISVRIYDPEGSLIRTLVDASPRAPGTVAESWDGRNDASGQVPDARYTYRIAAQDPAGNSGAQQAGTVLVDTTPPSAAITDPNDNWTTDDTSPVLSASATDTVGIRGLQFQLSSDNGTTWADVGDIKVSEPYTVEIPGPLPDGPYVVRVAVTDTAGNSATSQAVSFTVETNTGPTEVCGPITRPATWRTSGGPYVVTCDVTVSSGVTLQIEAGAEIRFSETTGLTVDGTLTAIGTPSKPITFTAGTASPSPGYWNGITIGPESTGSVLDGVTVEYGGRWFFAYDRVWYGNINSYGSNPIIRNSTIRHSGYSGINSYYGSTGTIAGNTISDNAWSGIDIYAGSSPSVTGNIIRNNSSSAIRVYDSSLPTITGNTIADNGSYGLHVTAGSAQTATGNTFAGTAVNNVVYVAGGTISRDATWTSQGVPYVIGGDLNIRGPSTPALTIGPNSVLKFMPATALNVAGDTNDTAGGIVADGSAGQVFFTSAKDDSLGGDTNGDGSSTTPWAGNWLGISFGHSAADRSLLDHVTVLYGGQESLVRPTHSYDNIDIYGSNPSIRSSTISFSYRYGIQVAGPASPTIAGSTVDNNTSSGFFVADGSTPTISGNTISDNGGYGVQLPASSVNLASGNTFSGNYADNTIYVRGGTITDDSVWEYPGFPYLIGGDIYVRGSASPMLTIAPGNTLKFLAYTGLYVGGDTPETAGGLFADGGAGQILFTSATPDKQKWRGILFGDSSSDSSVLDHVVVEKGGIGTYLYSTWWNANINICGASPTIRSSTTTQSSKYGIQISQGSSPIIEGNQIISNGADGIIAYDTSAPTITGNTIADNLANGLVIPASSMHLATSNSFSGNDRNNTIHVTGGTISQSVTWTNQGATYWIQGDLFVRGPSSPTLTIGGGSILKFPPYSGLYVGGDTPETAGGLLADGNTAPIIITSAKDDSVGGDTNIDGAATTPAPGDWRGIFFGDSALDSSLLNRVTVLYGGQPTSVYANWWFGNINVSNSSPTVVHSTTRYAGRYGIETAGASPAINQSNISDNPWEGVHNITPSLLVSAENNWWGAASGPYHPTLNPSGAGNAVTNGVSFSPWALEPVQNP